MNLSIIDYHQRIVELFTLFVRNKTYESKLSALAGEPFDIQKLTLNDLEPILNEDDSSIMDGVKFRIGQWSFSVFIEECSIWVLNKNPNAMDMTVLCMHNDNFCHRPNFRFDSTAPINIDQTQIDYVVSNLIEGPKRRIAITLREAQKYLADPTYYDTLKVALDIKFRKKK